MAIIIILLFVGLFISFGMGYEYGSKNEELSSKDIFRCLQKHEIPIAEGNYSVRIRDDNFIIVTYTRGNYWWAEWGVGC